MDAPISEDGKFSLLDTFDSKDYAGPEDNLMKLSLQKDLESVFSTLTSREAEILKLFYGIGQESAISLDEIGLRMDISRERVRQLKEAALISIKRSNRATILLKYLG